MYNAKIIKAKKQKNITKNKWAKKQHKLSGFTDFSIVYENNKKKLKNRFSMLVAHVKSLNRGR